MSAMKKMNRAEKFHRRSQLKLGWSVLHEPYRLMQVKEIAVRAQRHWNLMRKCWGGWQRLVDMARARNGRKYTFAREHYNAVLKIKMLAGWQEGARAMKTERRGLLRRLKMRTKVDGWLNEEKTTEEKVLKSKDSDIKFNNVDEKIKLLLEYIDNRDAYKMNDYLKNHCFE